MGEIASLTGNSNDAKDFIKTSREYMNKWEKYTFGQDSTHARLAYQLSDSWGLSWIVSSLTQGSLYNAYPDDLLGLRLFPERVRDKQDAWYYKKTSLSSASVINLADKYGLPLDSRHTYTKSDWEMFIAAISKTQTRNILIDHLATWINETSTGTPKVVHWWRRPSIYGFVRCHWNRRVSWNYIYESTCCWRAFRFIGS